MFDPSKCKFKAPEIRLYVASWGHDNLVTHDYDGNIRPIVFQYSEQKVMGSVDSDIRTCYAYHISSDGHKHGVEYLTKDSGEKAKLWNAGSMLKLFTNFFSEKYGAEKPTFSKGEMSNQRNVVYADYANGIKLGVHIARPDAGSESVWFTIQEGENFARRFAFAEKKAFIKECHKALSI